MKTEDDHRTVLLTKRKVGGLGILVRQSSSTSCLVVSHVVKRGPAEQLNGAIKIGDTIVAVNGKRLEDFTFDDALALLSEIKVGQSASLVIHRLENEPDSNSKTNGTYSSIETNGTLDTNGHNEKKQLNGSEAQCSAVGGHRTVDSVNNQSTFSFVKLKNLLESTQSVDTLHRQSLPSHCTNKRCMGSLLEPYGGDGLEAQPPNSLKPKHLVESEAKAFIDEYYASQQRSNTEAHRERLDEVLTSIHATGTYHIEEKELIFGAKLAWRNAPRCIGRIQWSKLQLFDYRHVTTTQEMFEAICNHLRYATNKGKIRSTITVFPPRVEPNRDFRVWNPQLVQYAGYQRDDGTIIGDPNNVEFAELCVSLGWKAPRTDFDVLPLVLQANGRDPDLYEIPKDFVLEVNIKHPRYKELDSLGLRWYAVPAVSGMLFDVGGIEFPGSPFNGWYMTTEISARNFSDVNRLNKLKDVARVLGFDTSSLSTMWKDRAVVELTCAVMHSYNEAGVSMMDHHTAAESFMKHLQDEQRLRGGCPADWVWITPPLAAATTPVFHQEMLYYHLKPSYEYQEAAWKRHIFRKKVKPTKKKYGFREVAKAVQLSASMMGRALAKRHKATILFASETGKSEGYAKQLQCIFSHAFDPKVVCMNEYEISELEHEQLVLVVTSTFGNGEAPENGELFGDLLYKLRHPEISKLKGNIHLQKSIDELSVKANGRLSNLRFSVFGLGSRAYPNFCAFANSIHKLVTGLGGECIHPIGEGDELCGQEESFRSWAKSVFKAACTQFCIEGENAAGDCNEESFLTTWAPGKFTFADTTETCDNFVTDAAKLHGGKAVLAKTISVKNLQHEKSERSTILVKFSRKDVPSLNYQPGDHLAVYPCNDAVLVQGILHLLHDKPADNQAVDINVCHERNGGITTRSLRQPFKRFPAKCTLEVALLYLLDITSPPTPQFLSQLQPLATNEEDGHRLKLLAEGGSIYEDWKYEKYPTILEVLQEFSSLQVPALFLLTQLPLMKTRYYSISSSPLLHPNEIHITVAVVNYRTLGGMGLLHKGVCSTWLHCLQPGDNIPCFVRTAANFHLPEDKAAPVIMVGPGTGIAPLRSFWQHRKEEMDRQPTLSESDPISNGDGDAVANSDPLHNGEPDVVNGNGTWGPMKLYFGCRDPVLDNIYQEELEDYHKCGVLSDVNFAFSRAPNQPKMYVQNLLQQNGSDVVEDLVMRNGHMYVCGDVSMAADVGRTLQTVLEKCAAMSQQEAQAFLEDMRSEGRYHEDIFGITLRLAEVTDRVRTAARKAWVYLSGAKKTFARTSSSDIQRKSRRLSQRSETVTVVMQDHERKPK